MRKNCTRSSPSHDFPLAFWSTFNDFPPYSGHLQQPLQKHLISAGRKLFIIPLGNLGKSIYDVIIKLNFIWLILVLQGFFYPTRSQSHGFYKPPRYLWRKRVRLLYYRLNEPIYIPLKWWWIFANIFTIFPCNFKANFVTLMMSKWDLQTRGINF